MILLWAIATTLPIPSESTARIVSIASQLLAIAQSNIKRMLAYSTIGHVGFIFLGLLTGTKAGLEAALYYTIVYVIMAAAAFGVLILMSRKGHDVELLDDFKGLNQRSPWFAAMMMLIMVSMLGLPPLAGFYAKWWVLAAVVNAGQLWLAIVAVIFSVIGAFYYCLLYTSPSPRD